MSKLYNVLLSAKSMLLKQRLESVYVNEILLHYVNSEYRQRMKSHTMSA